MPPGWAVVDSNGDTCTWEVLPSDEWYANAMPPEPGDYIAGYDDRAAGFNYATVEELICPAIYTDTLQNIRLVYGVGYQNYQDGDSLLVRVRSFGDTSWSQWDTLLVYDRDIGSRQETLLLDPHLPAESLQVEFVWADHSWGHRQLYAAVDNIVFETLFLPDVDISARAVLRPREPERVNAPFSPVLLLKNTGSNPVHQDITGVMVIIDPGDSVVFVDTSVVIGGLAPGDSLQMFFSSWTPQEAGGFYRAVGFHTLLDSVSSNDTAFADFSVIPESLTRWINVPFSENRPVIDGRMEAGEWDDAAGWDVSDYLGLDAAPDPFGSCQTLAKHDGDTLFVCIACQDSTPLDRVELLFDDNASASWPSQDTTEGRNKISRDTTGWQSAWFKEDYTYGPWRPTGFNSFAFCDSAGVAEMAVPMAGFSDTGPEFLGVIPKNTQDTAGVLIRAENASGLACNWPQDASRFYDPAGFGLLIFQPGSSNRESRRAQNTMNTIYLTGKGLVLRWPGSSEITLRLFDPAGRLVQTLFKGRLGPGTHLFPVHQKPGVYVALATWEHGTIRTKLVILP